MAEKRDATEFNNYEYSYSTRYRYRDMHYHEKRDVVRQKVILKTPRWCDLSVSTREFLDKLPKVHTKEGLKTLISLVKNYKELVYKKVYNYIVMNKIVSNSLRLEFMSRVKFISEEEYKAKHKKTTMKKPKKKSKKLNSSHCGSTLASRRTDGINIAQQLTYRNSVVRPDEEYEYGLSDW